MISLDRKYQTRDGRPARVYAVDGVKHWPVHGAVFESGAWTMCAWKLDGAFPGASASHHNDLIEVKPKITRTYWMLHTKDGDLYPYGGKNAERNCRDDAPSIHGAIAITGPHTEEFQEGDGL